MKTLNLSTACVAAAALALAASVADAAYMLDDTDQTVSITKGGGNFANVKIMNTITPAQAAEFANYTELKVDVVKTAHVQADNLAIATNSQLTGYQGRDPRVWMASEGQTTTLTFNYANDTAFKNAAAQWAQDMGGWRELMLESNWPTYTGTNTYSVTAIYLDTPVPEPTAAGLVAGGAGLLAARRRRRA